MTRTTRGDLAPRTAVLIDLENILHLEEDPVPGTVACCGDPVAHRDDDARTVDLHRSQTLSDYSWVCDATAERALAEVRSVTGPADFLIAAAVTPLLCRTAFLPSMRGVAIRDVPAEPDAADRFLIDVAEHLADRGFTRFVVVSGDGAFADFASRHHTVVVARSGRSLSSALAMSATEVRLLAPRTAAASAVSA